MKNFSSALLSFVQNNKAFNRADLFAIWPGSLQNLLAQSQQLQTSPWAGGGSAGAAVATGNAVTAPDGSLTATQLVFPITGGGQESYWQQNSTIVPVVGISWTFSCWLRAASNLSTNIRLVQATGENDTIVPVSLTTTWTRFSMTITPSSVGTGVMLARLDQVASQPSITIFAWGAQLEMRNGLGPYTATGTQPAWGSSGPCVPGIFANSSQVNLTYNGVQYFSDSNASWRRGTITSEASFDLRGNDMDLIALPAFGQSSFKNVLFPNTSVSYMAAAQLGMFDAALVQIYTAYWPIGMNQSAAINSFIASTGVETKWAGYIKPNGQIGRASIKFQCADVLYLLNQNMPRRLLQASCNHTLFDPNCTLNPFSFKSPLMTVASGSTAQSLNTTGSLGQSSPYFAQGYISFYSGQNQGWTFAIKSQTSTTNLLLAKAVPFPLAIGDTFIAFAGCDKTEGTCNSKFSNLVHFGGTSFVPNPEVAI